MPKHRHQEWLKFLKQIWRLSPGPSKAGGAGHPQACLRKARSPQPSDAQHRGPRQRARAWVEWVGAVGREADSA